MLYPSLDPNERFRERRDAARRRKRRRRAAAVGLLLLLLLALAGGMTLATKGGKSTASSSSRARTTASTSASGTAVTIVRTPKRAAVRVPGALPLEMRGIHVTGPLASLPGRLDTYLALSARGLNTIQMDIRDEGGVVSFPVDVPLARSSGAIREYFDPRALVRKAHARGIHLIGRIVVFQDPIVSSARPDLAIRRPDGSVWKTREGLGWLNPYDRRVWGYAVAIAEEAAKAGFDEIMFDYVRFPTDGDIGTAVYAGRTTQPRARVIEDFTQFAQRRLSPYGVRLSAALFGLSATRDLGIGQLPRLVSRHLDIVYPMAYPALYGGGELGIESPSRQPGETVFRTLSDFREQVQAQALLIPWIQDWNYPPELVKAQVEAARLQGAKGYLLWNANGDYTAAALSPPASG